MTDPRMTPTNDAPVTDDDGPCTTCDDTGMTIQTERPCSCEAGDQYRANGDAPVTVEQMEGCPFCGTSDNLFIEPSETGSGGQWVSPIYAGCSVNGCGISATGDDAAEAVSKWNTRLAALASAPAGDAFADAGKPISRAGDGVEAGKVLDDIVPLSIASTWDEAERRNIIRAMQEYAALVRPRAAVGEPLPADVAELVNRIGRAEWGATDALDADEHGKHVADSVRITAANFGQTEPQRMQGLYVEGTETVICHVGTSPNSPAVARALAGAWNHLCDLAALQSPPAKVEP